MIVVTGTMELNPDGVAAARAAAVEMMQETRKEEGCLVYEFSQLIEHEATFRVYEEWESLDALKAHGQAPHMGVFRAALAEAGVISRDIVWMPGGDKTSL